MAKRKSGLGEIILVAVVLGISSLFGFIAANLVGVIITIAIVAMFFLWLKARRKKRALLEFEARKQYLLDKYKNIASAHRLELAGLDTRACWDYRKRFSKLRHRFRSVAVSGRSGQTQGNKSRSLKSS